MAPHALVDVDLALQFVDPLLPSLLLGAKSRLELAQLPAIACKAACVGLLYLPPYSPAFNRMERRWQASIPG
jgi:hypothetical protein